MAKVPVYDGGKIIGRVRYNANLDFWDGHNWTCGSLGRHLGLTRLKDGRFVLIHGTDWQGERDYADVISKEEALQYVLRSGNDELLKKYFPDHKVDLEEDE